MINAQWLRVQHRRSQKKTKDQPKDTEEEGHFECKVLEIPEFFLTSEKTTGQVKLVGRLN